MATNSSTSSSSQTVVFNDDNLLTEILLKLPTKPLVKLKSISKQWNSIISSGTFNRLHTLLHPPNADPTSGVFLRRTDPNSRNFNYHFLSFPFGPLSLSPLQFPCSFPSPKLLQSCNGLLLFSSASHINNYQIYNPTTSQSKYLPQLTLTAPARVLGVSLGFDPPRFDGSRVVCVTTTETSAYNYRIFMYSSSIGSWKEWEGNPFTAPFDAGFSNGIYWNGAFHWISLKDDSVRFDVQSEKLDSFPSPPISPKSRGCRQFCELNGKLHYADVDEFRSPVCRIFALVDYGWVLMYSVYVPEMLIGESRGFSMLCFVCKEEGEKERRMEMVVHLRKKILAYDLESKNWRTICGVEFGGDLASNRLQFGCFDAYAYTATLALF